MSEGRLVQVVSLCRVPWGEHLTPLERGQQGPPKWYLPMSWPLEVFAVVGLMQVQGSSVDQVRAF